MTGGFVVLVGPDGVGKSTVALELADSYKGPVGYVHFRPPVRGRLESRPDTTAAPHAKSATPGPRVLGWLRLARNWVVFWFGYLRIVRPAMRAGALVVGDRWCYSYLLQPASVRYAGPAWLAAWAVRTMPAPDLVAVLDAPAELVRARKTELSVAQIEAERAAASRIPHRRVLYMDASRSPQQLAGEILVALGPQ